MRKFLFLDKFGNLTLSIPVSTDTLETSKVIRQNVCINNDGDVVDDNLNVIVSVLVLDYSDDSFTEYTLTPKVIKEVQIT